NLNAVALQARLYGGGAVRFLARKKITRQDRHLRAKPSKGLAELATDGAGAENHHPARQLGKPEDVFIGQIVDALQPRHRKARSTRTRGDHRARKLEAALAG